MLRQIFKDSFIYSAAGLFTGGALFFVLPFYTRLLSVEAYGVYEYLSIVGALVVVTVALEVTMAVARFVPEVRDSPARVRAYASTALWFTVLMHGAVVAAVVAFGPGAAQLLLGDARHAQVLLAAVLSFAVAGVTNIMVTQLQWELRAKASALLSVVSAIASLGVSLVLVWGLQWGLIGAFMGPVAAGVVVVPLGLRLARGSFGLTFSPQALRQMLGFSFPLVFSSVGWVLASYLDRLAIKELLTFEDVAVYGVGFRIAGMVMLLMTGLQGSVSPMIFAHHADAATPGRVAQMLRLFSAVALVVCGGLSAFAPELLWIFATPAYADAALVIPFLALSLVLARFYIFAPGLWLAKRTMLYAGINIAMGGLNLGLNYLMIPHWGIMGAAAATLVSAGATFGAVMFFSQRYYPVPHRFGPLVLMTGAGLAIMLLAVWGHHVHDIGFLARLGAFFSLLVLPFVFGVVSREEVREAVRMARERMGL